MKDETRLGKNIKALRKAYGETQEKLGNYLHVEKSAISSYENGARSLDQQKLEMIAKHYSISVEELTTSDLSCLENIRISVNPNLFWEKIELVLPIISNENAMQNIHFKTAYDLHKAMYSDFNNHKLDSLCKIDKMIEEYEFAHDDDTSKLPSAANRISLYFLLCVILKTPEVYINQPASLLQFAAKDRRVKKMIDNIDPEFVKDSMKMKEVLFDPESLEEIFKFKSELKHSKDYSDLADYYFALEFACGHVDNDLSQEINLRICIEMMKCYESFGNTYASNYISYSLSSLLGSSQNVDDT